VTAVGKNVEEARQKAYATVKRIKWKDGFFRDDIGFKNF
jgi:phosphoribosylamine--glycine ligase